MQRAEHILWRLIGDYWEVVDVLNEDATQN